MADHSIITILLPGKPPRTCDLDAMLRSKTERSAAYPGWDGFTLYLGRGEMHGGGSNAPHNDIVIEDAPFVSRAQCLFQFVNGDWYLADNNSKNGIILQNRKISSCKMRDGDKFYIGEQAERRMLLMYSVKAAEDAEPVTGLPLNPSGRFVIGRDESCDMVIAHPTVSRQHCFITGLNGSFYIEDNHSTNGILLNGHPVKQRTQIREMDKIFIAGIRLYFSNGYLYLNEPEDGISLSAEKVCKKVGKKKHQKFILKDVDLTIRPDEFVALIGGSGAGKTTLLNCLSGMAGFTSGAVLINGEKIHTAGKSLQSLIGYVPQQDIVYDNLTMERMLYHSARLRMPKDTTKEEIQAKIKETLEIVELSEHKNTLISKLSGGQRKRASIAVELLASPKLFFLDEPSSGLDPGTEKHLMKMLKRLSLSGKTVIMVTHTVQNIDMCDRLICMGKGGVVCYSGSPEGARKFFGKENLTDIYDDLNDIAAATAQRWREQQKDMGEEAEPDQQPRQVKKGRGASWPRQFLVQSLRYAEIFKNSLPRLLLLLMMPAVLTFLVCFAYQADGGIYRFLGLHLGVIVVRNIFPFLSAPDTLSLISAFSCAAFWVGIFNSIQEVSKERNIYERERFTGVSPSSYLMSKVVIMTLLCLIQSLIMTGLFWLLGHTWAMASATTTSAKDVFIKIPTSGGLVFTGRLFGLEVFMTVFLCTMSAMCLGLMISTLVSNDMALVLCPICLLPQILFSGVATQLSGITETVSNIISCRWSCIAMLTSLNVNDMYTDYAYAENGTGFGGSTLYQNAVYDSLNTYLFGQNPVISGWIAFLLLCLVFLVAAFLILRFKPRRERG